MSAPDFTRTPPDFLGRLDRDLARHVHAENQQETFQRDLAVARTLAPPTIPEPLMALDLKIKGLSESVSAARKGIASVREVAVGLNASTKAFVETAGEVKKQIDAAREDLEFEATNLGNSSAASSGESEKQG